MKTTARALWIACLLGASSLWGCTPETATAPAVPQGSYSSAACGGSGTEIVMLIDTSTRMGSSSDVKKGNSFLSREQLVIDALKRSQPHLKKWVDFGLLTFPFIDAKDGGNTSFGPDTCEVGDVAVEPGDPYGWIVNRLEHVQVGGNAAVGAALLKARDYYLGHAANGRSRAVVLFTGGGDQCNGNALAAVDALKAIGVNTFVVSYQDADDQQLLAALAAHGGWNNAARPGLVSYLQSTSGIDLLDSALASTAAVEICDGIDNDCDGMTDEGFDDDGDGWSTCMGDCDDHSASVYPGASDGPRVAPYSAARVSAYFQGRTAGGAAVNAVSSNPAEGLDFDATDDDGAFFALGFDGFLEVEFDCPVQNGPGADLRIYEKTYRGSTVYSTETADVHAFDPVNQVWVKLGQATNLPVEARPNVATEFDLGLLASVNRIRIVNATPIGSVAASSDGFDVNGVYAMHDCGACDGRDNDCNGDVDEGYNPGASCTVTVGAACHVSGALACDAAGLGSVCVTPAFQVSAETCDGIDNDCDGQVDEGLSQACQTTCGSGHRACAAGAWGECVVEAPKAELCNGVDDNCDGQVDEGFNVDEECFVGKFACATTGIRVCSADGLESVCQVTGGAPEGSGFSETCNGIDDDCDGLVDNGKGLCPDGQICYKGTCIYE